ncbi:MAG: hypothetical protein BMS9Abin05_1340 [Rhodothermia bacterium]|nr:MAG: hypothetical protein BMS9Abin05_1340 [Rhodothermia bacterium]
MTKAKSSIPPERVDVYERQIAAYPLIERKGAANPYTSVIGHMFSCLNKRGEVGLRLSKADREIFLEEHQTKLFESYGAVMKEYVTVPDSLISSKEKFQPYLNTSYDYVKSLKPKPTTRKRK